jgi:hypothetical protein
MGAVGLAFVAVLSRWFKYRHPKDHIPHNPQPRIFKKNCDVAEGFRTQLIIQAYI